MSIRKIRDSGFCIGCGACAVVDNNMRMSLNEHEMFQVEFKEDSSLDEEKALHICPFSNSGPDEDKIGKALYGNTCEHDDRLGYYKTLNVGFVAEGEFRNKGTSGGIISWLCARLLEEKKVDQVLHVKPADPEKDGLHFRYGISRNTDEVLNGAKSRYYPVEMSEILNHIKTTPGNYVVVGLPCFIKSVRRLMLTDSIFQDRIKYCIGLVCGHLKSKAFADCFAWQENIQPGSLKEIDFRVKLPNKNAGEYGVRVKSSKSESLNESSSYFGSWWGHNFFRYSACNYCDDVFAETADVVVGDAWLKDYICDPKGNSIIVSRNDYLSNLIHAGKMSGSLKLSEESCDVIAHSQSGGLRDRREGLSYRLSKLPKNSYQIKKRVIPVKSQIPLSRRQIYAMRVILEKKSHQIFEIAKKNNNYQFFKKHMRKYIFINSILPGNFRRTFFRTASKIKKMILSKLH